MPNTTTFTALTEAYRARVEELARFLTEGEKREYERSFLEEDADLARYKDKYLLSDAEMEVGRLQHRSMELVRLLRNSYKWRPGDFHCAPRYDGVMVVEELATAYQLECDLGRWFSDVIEMKLRA